MKRTAFTLSILCFCLCASGRTVSRQDAESFAKNYTSSASLEFALDGSSATKSSLSPAFYAFNKPSGGWIIISADDCSTPVLAHSDTGSIDPDDLPCNMRNYLRIVARNISAASKASLAPSQRVRELWAANGVRTKAAESSKILQTASWGQNTPYNQTVKTKLNTSRDICTGCVATAMSIVLAYNKWPEKGTGTIAGYTSKATVEEYGVKETYTVPSTDISNYTYNWTDFPLTTPTTTAQKKAVADLMFHCGAMVEMTYSSNGSGAMSSDIIPALAKHMSYSAGAMELMRSNYSSYEWFGILKREIDSNRPVIYGGSDEETYEGHQFVCDGYNSDNEVHINWGWSGMLNGWYAVCYLGDKDNVEDVFNYYDTAIVGLAPEKSATPATGSPELYLYSQEEDNIYGLSVSQGKIAKGSTFYLLAAFILSDNTHYAYEGNVKASLVDRNGSIKEDIGRPTQISVDKATIDGGYITSGYTYLEDYPCTITKDIAVGDYIQLFYQISDGSWAPLGGYGHENELYTISKLSAIPDISYIRVPDEIKKGNVFYFDLVTGEKLPSSIAWYYDLSRQDKGYVKTSAGGTHTVKAVISYSDKSTQTIQRTISVL